MVEAVKVGDTVEYEDAYTHQNRFGRVTAVYGNEWIIRTITKKEAGANPKKFKPKAACAFDRLSDGTPVCRAHRQELQLLAVHGENPPGLGQVSAGICPISSATVIEASGM